MTVKTLLLGVVTGSMCVACSSNPNAGAAGERQRDTLVGAADTTKKGRPGGREMRLPAAPIGQAVAGGGGLDSFGGAELPASPAGAADTSDMPLAPKDAQWTIFCATLADPSHVETSKALKSALIQRTGMREWYILHESDRSQIYYGF